MNARILSLSSIAVAITLAWLFYSALVAVAAPLEPPAVPKFQASAAVSDLSIFARRRISIPFGIDSPLTLNGDGNQIFTTGPAECPDGGDTYALQVRVKQDAAVAIGKTDGSCNASEQKWLVEANAVGAAIFEEGEAQVCAFTLIDLGKGAATKRWCRDVVLAK